MSKIRKAPHDVGSSALYGITSKRRLAQVLGWAGSPSSILPFARRSSNYNVYLDESNPEKPRLVEAPRDAIKRLQKRIEGLLKRLKLPVYLHSALPGRSYLTNSIEHCGTTGCTVTLDVSEFFPSITVGRIERLFIVTFGCSRDIAEILSRLLCCNGHLATGSPASPIISFLAYREIFDRIDARATALNGKFTLYIDDIAMTGATVGHGDIKWITRLLARVALKVKRSKTRIFRASSAKMVTGRAFRNGISRAPNRQHRKLRAALDALRAAPNDASLRSSVQGRLRHLSLLDAYRAPTYRAAAKALRHAGSSTTDLLSLRPSETHVEVVETK